MRSSPLRFFVRSARRIVLTPAILLAAGSGPLLAQQVVVGASSGTVNSGGTYSGSYAFSNSYDQSGLSNPFVSGVTAWSTYFGLNPTHSYVAIPNEWWSSDGVTTATVTWDLGSLMSLSALALWNEDLVGAPRFNLLYSTDGTNFTSLLSGQTPTDNPTNSNYTANIFTWAATSMRYVRMEIGGCVNNCAIGEVAFRGEGSLIDPGLPGSTVPEPASMVLLATGLLGLAGVSAVRRRKLGA